MDSLAEIMARLERRAFAQEEERRVSPQALPPLASAEHVPLPRALPQTARRPYRQTSRPKPHTVPSLMTENA